MRKPVKLAACASFFALIVAASCSRRTSIQSASGPQSNDARSHATQSAIPGGVQDNARKAPFSAGTQNPADSSQESALDQQSAQEAGPGIPFGDSPSLPIGTLLTVRLENPVSVVSADASGAFDAIVDEPVIVNGVTRIPSGANVIGRVESARASELKRDRAYFRLTLSTIEIAGKDIPVHTSSLFARGSSSPVPALQNANRVSSRTNPEISSHISTRVSNGASPFHLDPGRRLTFRLNEPVYTVSERPVPAH